MVWKCSCGSQNISTRKQCKACGLLKGAKPVVAPPSHSAQLTKHVAISDKVGGKRTKTAITAILAQEKYVYTSSFYTNMRLFKAKKWAEARKLLMALKGSEQKSEILKLCLVCACLQLDHNKQAETLLNSFPTSTTYERKVWHLLGWTYYHLNKWSQSRYSYRAAEEFPEKLPNICDDYGV